jgi:hypothetical protein
MKDVPQFIRNRLADTDAKMFAKVYIGATGGGYYASTLPYDFTHAGKTWKGKSGLKEIDTTTQDDRVSRDPYSISIVDDANSSLEFRLQVGQPMTIAVGFYDPNRNQPNTEDFLTLYNGRIDFWSRSIGSDNQRILQIQGVSPSGVLSLTRGVYTDIVYTRQIDSTDTSMQTIGRMRSDDIVLDWGKPR